MNNIEWISSPWWSESIDTQNLSVEKLEGESGESPPFPQYHYILIIVFVWLPDIHNTRSVVQVLHVVVSLKEKFTQK